MHVIVWVKAVAGRAAFDLHAEILASHDIALRQPFQHLWQEDISVIFSRAAGTARLVLWDEDISVILFGAVGTYWLKIRIRVQITAHVIEGLGDDLVTVHL